MVFIITGGPGFGKTTLITQLGKLDYCVSNEIAREIIEEQLLTGGDILPWNNNHKFEEIITNRRVEFLKSVPDSCIAFSDRGLPDQIAYSWYKNKNESKLIIEAVEKYRYAPIVFITPPWKDIYTNDNIRKETFEEAVEIHYFILKAYKSVGYKTIDIPFTNNNERVDFVFKTIYNYLKTNKI